MKTLLTTLMTVFALAASPFAFASKVCQEDPRLYTIKMVLSELESGQAIKPLSISPATFLSLTSKTRKALGDNISVLDENCVPVQVVNGEPAKKIAIPYEALITELHHSAIRQDSAGMLQLLRLFKAAPKPSGEIINLIKTLGWTPQATAWARNVGIVPSHPQLPMTNYASSRREMQCETVLAQPTHIELYAILGGHVSDKRTIVSYDIDNHSSPLHFYATNGMYNVLNQFALPPTNKKVDKVCRDVNADSILAALTAIGTITHYNPVNSIDRYRGMQNKMQETFPEAYSAPSSAN